MIEGDRKPVSGTSDLLAFKPIAAILSGIVAIRFLSLPAYPIIDKSEARYAFIGELMVQTGNWITPFIQHNVPFWAKPILMFWLTAASFTVFGINEFAARLPSFLIFVLVIYFIVLLGAGERDRKFGLAAACVFASSALSFYLGGTVMTDPGLLLGVTIVMASFWKCMDGKGAPSKVWGYLFFIGLSIGVLAKGPIGAVIPGMSIAVWITQHRKWGDTWRRLPWIGGTILALILVLPWYVYAEHRTPGFLSYFIIGEHIERFLVPEWSGDLYGGGRPRAVGTIWLFGLIAVLPWSVVLAFLLLRPQVRRELFQKSAIQDPWLSYLFYWLLAPLVLFTFARNILITYVATGLPAFAILTAHGLLRISERRDRYPLAATAASVPLLFLAAIVMVSVDPGTRYLRSQAGIVAAYKKMTAGKPSELVYAFDKPYSADFYSGGKATYVRDGDGIMTMMQRGHRYFVVPADVYPRLPEDLRQRLEIVAQRNRSVLLRPRPNTQVPH